MWISLLTALVPLSLFQRIFHEMMHLKKTHTFVDFGHGIGNACFQAAYTVGCDAKGVELVNARYFVSEALNRGLFRAASSDKNRAAGSVILKHGRIEDAALREWLTDVDAVFVNNFHGVFNCRSGQKKCANRYIDHYIAALFAQMKPGTVMVTMDEILQLGLPLSSINEKRKNRQLSVSSNASFFSLEKMELGPANETVTWSENGGCRNMVQVYKYTRLAQDDDAQGAVILCANPGCAHARNETPIPATKVEDGRLVMNCCDCKIEPTNTRARRRRNYGHRYNGDEYAT
jgi:hypothetical protein